MMRSRANVTPRTSTPLGASDELDELDELDEPVDVARPSPHGRRIVLVLALAALAPWCAECSWGGFTLTWFPVVVLFLGPVYGGAAVLIREVSRRTGGGWPAIVLLSGAFGLLMAGLIDQSLFNPGFLADTEFAGLRAVSEQTLVPGLGFSAQDAIGYVGGHIVLSVCAPIALIESFAGPDLRRRPWLSGRGLTVVALAFVLGALLVFTDDDGRGDFMVSPLQLSFTVLTALALIAVAAMLPRWRRRRLRRLRRPRREREGAVAAGPAPSPLWTGVAVLAARLGEDVMPSGWAGVALRIMLAAIAAVAITVLSRRPGWGQEHILAVCAAGLVAAGVGAYFAPQYDAASPAEGLISDIAVSVITIALVTAAFLRLRSGGVAAQGLAVRRE